MALDDRVHHGYHRRIRDPLLGGSSTMNPKRLISLKWWWSHWSNVLLYSGMATVFVICIWLLSEQLDRNARATYEQSLVDWRADIRDCERGNKNATVLYDFLFEATAAPDPRQYDFITDPQLRAGVIEQATRRSEEMRGKIAVFVPRDCNTAYPQPQPPEDE